MRRIFWDRMGKVQVSIIIVNYNTKDLTRDCLKSIFEQTQEIEFEVIVSDNASTDGSVEMIRSEFPQVVLIENHTNLGFGAANNRGLKIAKGEFIFYLNSDTILLNNAVKLFYDYWQNAPDKDEIGVLGAMLLDGNGQTIHSFGQIKSIDTKLKELFRCWIGISRRTLKYFFTHKLNKVVFEHNQANFFGEVSYVTGADMFLKNNEMAKFDERFFMYCEETDLQLQLKKEGKKSFIIEGPMIIHLSGGSTKKALYEVIHLGTPGQIQLSLSNIKFMKKNYYSPIKIFVLKVLTLFIWLNPLIFSNTKVKIKEMLAL